MRMNGSEGHKVIEPPLPGYAFNGIVWGPESSLLSVSLITPEVQDGVIILQPDNCEVYILPALHGRFDGLFIP